MCPDETPVGVTCNSTPMTACTPQTTNLPFMLSDGDISAIRLEIKVIYERMNSMRKANLIFDCQIWGTQWEAVANFVLSVRHLEDAAMRLGKVLQQMQGGESIYAQVDIDNTTEKVELDKNAV